MENTTYLKSQIEACAVCRHVKLKHKECPWCSRTPEEISEDIKRFSKISLERKSNINSHKKKKRKSEIVIECAPEPKVYIRKRFLIKGLTMLSVEMFEERGVMIANLILRGCSSYYIHGLDHSLNQKKLHILEKIYSILQ